MCDNGTVSIQVGNLPDDLQIDVYPFVEEVKECDSFGVLSMLDFEMVAKKIESGEPSAKMYYCDSFMYLKRKLSIPSNTDCTSLLADAPIVLDRLKDRIKLGKDVKMDKLINISDTWKAIDRFAALEYIGRVFWTLYLAVEAAKRRRYGEFDIPRSFEFRKVNADEVVITVYILFGGQPKRVEIRFSHRTLESGKEISSNFDVEMNGEPLPPKMWADIFPSILESTGKWDYKECWWTFFDGGLILFDYNKSALNERAKVYLSALLDVMKVNPHLQLEISGYTDTAGSERYNLKLGRQRAKAVMDYLVKSGIDSGRLEIVSGGEEKPVDAKADEERNDYNRNVQLKAFVRNGKGEKKYSVRYYGEGADIVKGEKFNCTTPTSSSDPVYR